MRVCYESCCEKVICMRRGWMISAIMVVCLQCAGDLAWAVTVVLRGASEPLYGYLVEEDSTRIVVRVAVAADRFEERVLRREDIELLYRPVDAERLEALDPANPDAYYEYAEMLADKKRDPEARELSLRLYLLAARLDPARLGRSALLAMTALATSDAERRRYRAMAYLIDQGKDKSLLEMRSEEVPASVGQWDRPRKAAYLALDAWRSGDAATALSYLRSPEVVQAIDQLGGPLRAEDVVAECRKLRAGGPPPRQMQVYTIVIMQRKLLAASGSAQLRVGSTQAWSVLSKETISQRVQPLTWETLTDFDPAAVLYRRGRWVRSDESIHVAPDGR